jgi:hypothetical protein
VLMMQHAYYVRSNARRWALRRNGLGGFNVVGGDLKQMTACPSNTSPARPYIRPPEGKTMADLIREGEQRYGEGPDTR